MALFIVYMQQNQIFSHKYIAKIMTLMSLKMVLTSDIQGYLQSMTIDAPTPSQYSKNFPTVLKSWPGLVEFKGKSIWTIKFGKV